MLYRKRMGCILELVEDIDGIGTGFEAHIPWGWSLEARGWKQA